MFWVVTRRLVGRRPNSRPGQAYVISSLLIWMLTAYWRKERRPGKLTAMTLNEE
jgi:hypothetical protein